MGKNHTRSGHRVPDRLRAAVFHRDDYACVDCGSRSRIECDHIVPVERGGRTVFDNLQTLCRACHISKTRRENGATEGAIEWTRFITRRQRRHG